MIYKLHSNLDLNMQLAKWQRLLLCVQEITMEEALIIFPDSTPQEIEQKRKMILERIQNEVNYYRRQL